MKKRLLLVGLLLGAMMIFTACGGDEDANDNGAQGDLVVQAGDEVSVEYEGRFLDGEVFDASADRGQPMTFIVGVSPMIPGFEAAVLGMAIGEEKTVEIPSDLAYGETGFPDPATGGYLIPPNTDLVFDIKVVDIVRPEAAEE